MASSSTHSPLPHVATLSDLLAIPEEDRRHELLDGELVIKAMSSGEHAAGQTGLAVWAGSRFNNRQIAKDRPGGWWLLAEVSIELARHQIVRPDIAGWRRDRHPERPKGFPVAERPDWVCEVMTDGDARRRDGLQKRRIYSDHGVGHYWMVDMERELLTVLRLEKEGYRDVLVAGRGETVRAEPFDSVELVVGVLFGDDDL